MRGDTIGFSFAAMAMSALLVVCLWFLYLKPDGPKKPDEPDGWTKFAHSTTRCQKVEVQGTTCVLCDGTFSEHMALSCRWAP